MLTKKMREPKPILEPQVEDVPVVIEPVKENVPEKKTMVGCGCWWRLHWGR